MLCWYLLVPTHDNFARNQSEARALIEDLPLSKENLMDEQFIPVGPLLPLGILIR